MLAQQESKAVLIERAGAELSLYMKAEGDLDNKQYTLHAMRIAGVVGLSFDDSDADFTLKSIIEAAKGHLD